MASPDVIRLHSGGLWPVDGFTLAQDQQEVARHEARHQARRDFAFILLTADETQALGCVYVLPLVPFLRDAAAPVAILTQVTDATAMITFWVRQDQQRTSLPQQVVAAVHDWLIHAWPFDDHVSRVNPAEEASLQALEQCGFRVRFDLTLDEPPHHYLFFAKAAS